MKNDKALIVLLVLISMMGLQGFNKDQLAYVKDRSEKHEKITFYVACWPESRDSHGRSEYGVLPGGYYLLSHDERFDLTAAELPQAYLVEAYLGSVNLTGANLKKANLRRAYLRACLKEAHLEGADLREADLTEAVLSSADLHGALINHETKGDINLLKSLGAVNIDELDAEELAVFFQRWQLIQTSEEAISSSRVPIISDQIGSANLLPAFDNTAANSTQPVAPLIRPEPIRLHEQHS